MTTGFSENAQKPPASSIVSDSPRTAASSRIFCISKSCPAMQRTTKQRMALSPSPGPERLNEKLSKLAASGEDRGTQAELDEIRQLICTQGFFAILKAPSPAQARMLDRLFLGDERVNADPPGKLRDDAVKANGVPVAPIQTRAKDEITLAVAQLIAPLRRYARKLTRDLTDAEDLLQDCLEHVVKSWHQRRADGDTHAWSFTIMRNLAFSGFRKKSHKDFYSSIDDEYGPAFSTPPLQEEGLLRRDLVNGLQGLSDEHRNILYLVTMSELPYEAVADVLCIPIGTVRSRLARAREKLACSINGEEVSVADTRASMNSD